MSCNDGTQHDTPCGGDGGSSSRRVTGPQPRGFRRQKQKEKSRAQTPWRQEQQQNQKRAPLINAAATATADGGLAVPSAQPGDVVYVVGHGPGILEEISTSRGRGKKRFRVRYPNGSCYHVAREEILRNENMANLPEMRVCSCTRTGNPQEALVLERGAGPRQFVYLGRAFDDSGRSASTPSAIFSLISTMVGGGVLSLPYAMSQCGLLLGPLVLCGAAAASTWTLDMLIACARTTGRDTFELVGHAALGECSRKFTIALVGVTTLLALIAYTVLLGDLFVPLVQLVDPRLDELQDTSALRIVVLCVATLVLSPMCFKDGMNSVRFLCYASVFSVSVVGAIVVFRAAEHVGEQHFVWSVSGGHPTQVAVAGKYAWWPSNWAEALYAIPVFGISFACHFNAFSTHTELQAPTRNRMRRVLILTMVFTAFLYVIIGASGYIYACEATCGNILLNFDSKDPLVIVGRSLLGIVLMLNMPLVVQPCRNSFYRLLSGSCCCPWGRSQVSADEERGGATSAGISLLQAQSVQDSQRSTAASTNASELGEAPEVQVQQQQDANEESRRESRVHVYLRSDLSVRDRSEALPAVDSYLPKCQTVQDSASVPTPLQRHMLTVGVLCFALLVSCFLQNVLVVWSIMGSTAAFLICFILPAVYWYQIVGPFASARLRCSVAALVWLAVGLATCCTVQTILKLGSASCPALKTYTQVER